MKRQHADFTTLPREVQELTLDIGGHRVLAYYEEGYEGQVMVISGNTLLGVMPSVQEGLKLANFAVSPEGGMRDIELTPAESVQKPEFGSFQEWKANQLHG